MRVAIIIAYNGASYLGSQIQTETNNTIFGQLEHILSKINIKFRVVASGRTDKGVHATGQVCHIDIPEYWDDLVKFKRVLNSMLPNTIKVKKVKKVDYNFHARYGAKKRVYRYIIKEDFSNPFEDQFITFIEDVNIKKLQNNIKLFIGEHNFTQFMKTGSDTTSNTRIIYKAFAYRYKGYVILNFEANGFLRTQIRLMVGSLFQLDSRQIKEQLKCTNTHKIKPAPSNGLYLAKIKY